MPNSLDDLIRGKNVIAVVCNQFGDTGKGKFSDYFAANWADVVARGTGGNNAGHTVVVNGRKRIFHLLPSGIVYDELGKINIIGNGMVLDLRVLNEELNELKKIEDSISKLSSNFEELSKKYDELEEKISSEKSEDVAQLRVAVNEINQIMKTALPALIKEVRDLKERK